jgi:hypothetical protein
MPAFDTPYVLVPCFYDEYSHLHPASYNGLFEYYGYNVNEKKLNINEDIYFIPLSTLTPKTIAKNFNSIKPLYPVIKAQAKGTIFETQLHLLQGNDKIDNDGTNPEIQRVYNQLLIAIEYNILFSLFIGKTYSESTLKCLQFIYENYCRNGLDDPFTNLIDELLKPIFYNYSSFTLKQSSLGYEFLLDEKKKNIKKFANMIYKRPRLENNSTILKKKDFNEDLLIFLEQFKSEKKVNVEECISEYNF